MNKTSIEWTHRPGTVGMTWNPIRARRKDNGKIGWACTHASTGCLHCYAESINKRWGTGLPFNVPSLDQVEFFVPEKTLREPFNQKTPATIFVGDMFDLFHEAIPEEFVGHIFAVMAQCPQHTFQVLTKRAAEMLDLIGNAEARYGPFADDVTAPWPLPNVWLGVSVENQKYADERIPLLLRTPAAVRFLSVEPMLEAISMDGGDFGNNGWWIECPKCQGDCSEPSQYGGGKPCGRCFGKDGSNQGTIPGIDWVICGGESGPGARPFNLTWPNLLLDQCEAAGVPFFMKQLGSNPIPWKLPNGTSFPMFKSAMRDRKGGDPAEWPERLRVRQFPSPQMEPAK